MDSPISLKATGRGRRRLVVNRLAEIGALSAALVAIVVLGILVWSVFSRGVHALNVDFFTKGPALFGETGGGVAPALVGSLLLVTIATLNAVSLFGADRRQRGALACLVALAALSAAMEELQCSW